MYLTKKKSDKALTNSNDHYYIHISPDLIVSG